MSARAGLRSCDIFKAHLVALVHQVLHVAEGRDYQLAQILDVGSQARVLSDFKIALVLWVEEVTNLFVVDLNVRNLDSDPLRAGKGVGGISGRGSREWFVQRLTRFGSCSIFSCASLKSLEQVRGMRPCAARENGMIS